MRRFWLLVILLSFFFVFARSSRASSTVNFTVTGTARYTFSGYIAPNSMITFLAGGVAVGTAKADSTGLFTINVDEGDTTAQTFSWYFTDTAGNVSPTYTKTVATGINNQLITSDIVMPPTIQMATTTVNIGDTVTISGYTVPNATMTVTIHSSDITENVTANSDGSWSLSVPASQLGSGTHTVSAIVTAKDGTVSESSSTLSFVVNQNAAVATPSPSPGTAVSSTTTSSPTLSFATSTPSVTFFPGDFNDDGHVDDGDLVDFLSHFGQPVTPPLKKFDLNHSGIIDIYDFSILLYYLRR